MLLICGRKLSGYLSTPHTAEEEAGTVAAQDPTRGSINLQSDLAILSQVLTQEEWKHVHTKIYT